ncbi:unnamed protein product [Sphagnum troendelagicum]|uniref:Microtubule-associated protein 70-2 n=1 Tax=Sphagnum troendelagicum TaxID=128251 RepID=A0ABP0U2M6_9BRYO
MAESLAASVADDNAAGMNGVYSNGKHFYLDNGGGPLLLPASSFSNKSADAKPKQRRSISRPGPDAEDIIHLLHGSDPVKVELNRLENEVRDKDRELSEAQAEIKALKLTERSTEKAFEELSEELEKVDEKLKAADIALENKNLEVKKINDEKKTALAAQFAAEATLRRVHAAQKDEDLPPIEAILAPLEAELRLAYKEIARLQDDNRALDRLTKSKEAALLLAERTVQTAEAKAAMVDDLQNRNQELLKQIEICQEENKILDKMHRQKVAEVEKLSTTVAELEEAVLAGGAAVNAARDYQRQVEELLEGKKTLERELARAKISANRVAVVVANEWKDANDKVMPVKQWLDERRFLQGEMQQLRDKLAIAERTAKSESQLKEKSQFRLKVLEEGLRLSTSRRQAGGSVEEAVRSASNGPTRRLSTGSEEASRLLTNGSRRQRSTITSQQKASVASTTLLRNGRMTSKSFDGGRPLNASTSNRPRTFSNGFEELHTGRTNAVEATKNQEGADLPCEKADVGASDGADDTVSGLLYDMLQKEVVALRKSSHEKDQSLKDKDDALEMLSKKVDTLTKAMEVEAKKMRREVTAVEKEVVILRAEKEQERRARRSSMTKAPVNSSSIPALGR